MTIITATSDPSDLSEPTSPDSPGIELPETFIDGNAADMKVSLTQFLNEQRTIIGGEINSDRRVITYMTEALVRKVATIAMIDEHLAELAQPVEPGQEVQS